MTPEKHDNRLTRWLLTATIALLALVLCLQLWQIFGKTAPGNVTDAPPLTQDASNPEPPQTAAAPRQAPAAPRQAPAASPEPQTPSAAAQAPVPSAQAPSSEAQAPAAGEEAAKNAAFTHAGVSAADAEAVRCKLDWDDGRQVYDIEFWVDNIEYDYEIDASSCAVLKAGQDWGSRHHEGGTQQPASFIGEEAAKSAALSHAGVSAADAGYIRCELDEDDGLWLYEIEFQAGGVEYDYEVDASTGAVVKAEQDR